MVHPSKTVQLIGVVLVSDMALVDVNCHAGEEHPSILFGLYVRVPNKVLDDENGHAEV
jgi:hypothetical protein